MSWNRALIPMSLFPLQPVWYQGFTLQFCHEVRHSEVTPAAFVDTGVWQLLFWNFLWWKNWLWIIISKVKKKKKRNLHSSRVMMWNYQQVCSSIVIMRVPLGEALPILIWLPLKPDPIQERTPLCTLYTNTKTIELSNALRWEICLCSFTHGDLHCSTASDFSFEPVKVRLCYILKDILKTASKEVLIPKNWKLISLFSPTDRLLSGFGLFCHFGACKQSTTNNPNRCQSKYSQVR